MYDVQPPLPPPPPVRPRRNKWLAQLAALLLGAALGLVLLVLLIGAAVARLTSPAHHHAGVTAPKASAPPRSPLPPQPAPTTPASPPPSSPASTSAGGPLRVVAIAAFDPSGGEAHTTADVHAAVDKSPATQWVSQIYNTADFGHLKPGIGLVVDLGRSADVHVLRVLLNAPGADLELRAGGSASGSLSAYKHVVSKPGAGRSVVFSLGAGRTARYWLLWCTKLPQAPDGWRLGVADMQFR